MNLWCALPYLLVLDFTSDFRFYDYYYIYCSYSALSLVSTCLLFTILTCQSTVRLYVLGSWWHEIMVYRWGFPCLDYSFDVLFLWSRDLKPYNQICRPRLYLVLSLYMCLSLLATWLLLHHSPGEFHLTPLDPHVQVMELGACGFSQLLIRVAQR